MSFRVCAISLRHGKLSRAHNIALGEFRLLTSMKYIVPLFQQNTGRVNLGLVNWDSFQAGFRMVMRGDRFVGVTWDPWWSERKSEGRRKRQQRVIAERRSLDKTGPRLSAEGEIFQLLRLVHHKRKHRERRNDSDRRKSPSREKLIGLQAFIREVGKGPISDENARLLIRVCAGLTTREIYEGWTKASGMAPFFRQLDWNAKENHQKFRVYAVASFLELLRPGSICWKGQSPSADDLSLVSRIVNTLGRASEKARLQSLRAFFQGGIGLEGMRKILSGESLSDKKEALLLVKANHKLKPKEFYEKLRGPLKDLGIELSSKPSSYQAVEIIRRLAEHSRPSANLRAGLRPKP